MDHCALGVFETYGLVPALTGADAALKAAAVHLQGYRATGAGLVSVRFSGDVSSVQVAIDAACSAASQVGTVRWQTVIPRTADGLQVIIEPAAPPPAEAAPSPDGQVADANRPGQPQAETAVKADAMPTVQQLYGMQVKDLRALARQLPGLALTRQQIRFARKEQLVTAILHSYRQLKE